MKVPQKVAKTLIKKPIQKTKAIIKTASAAPSPSGTYNVFLGAIAGAPLARFYSYGYNMTLAKLPIPQFANIGLKILAPLGIIGITKGFKLPFGNMINGVALGITAATALDFAFDLLMGGSITKGVSEKMSVKEPLALSSAGGFIEGLL